MIKILAVAFISRALLASFEYRESSPLSLFPGSPPVIENIEPVPGSNPALLPLFRYGYLSSSASNPYGMEGLYSGALSAGGGTGTFGLQGWWSRFGTDFYGENIIGAGGGFMPADFLSLGLEYHYYLLDLSADGLFLKTSLGDTGASLLLLPGNSLRLIFRQDNLTSLFKKERRDLLYPETSAGIAVCPVSGLWFSYNLQKTAFGYVNSFSLSASLLSSFRVKGGYSRETSSYSAAVSVRYNRYSVSYGFRYHSYLKATHSLGLTVSTRETPYRGMRYLSVKREEKKTPGKRIDIRSCTGEELRKIPPVSETLAGRIIKYRSMIGPVTEKALMQIGMPAEDIREFREYVYGLGESRHRGEKKQKLRRYHVSKRKKELRSRRRVFRKLLSTGIGASASLKLSELAVSGKREEIDRYLGSLRGITPARKKEIRAICGK